MNKLEEQKGKEFVKLKHSGEKWDKLSLGDGCDWWEEGFDAAIALDLPVKFFNWYQSINKMGHLDRIKAVTILNLPHYPTPEDFYKYWIDNIYKPE